MSFGPSRKWPYTLIPQTLGKPTPYMYTNLKTYAYTYNIKHTHTLPLSLTSKHKALLARAAVNGADLTLHKKNLTLQYPVHTQARIHVGSTQHPPSLTQPHPTLPHNVWSTHEQRPHGR
jgi:hypothetical protein